MNWKKVMIIGWIELKTEPFWFCFQHNRFVNTLIFSDMKRRKYPLKDKDNIKDKDIIKLVVVDKDDNKNAYEIEVKEMSKLESAIINIISYTLVIAILLSPIIIVIVIKYNKKKKG